MKSGNWYFFGTEVTSVGLEELAGPDPWDFIVNAPDHFDFMYRRVLRPIEYRPKPKKLKKPKKGAKRRWSLVG